MKSQARGTYIRIAPRKIRLVADTLRAKPVEEAQTILRFTAKRAADPISKILRSAVASAKSQYEVDESNLYISHIAVDEGPKLKRYRPRARGSAYPIQKKTSHITLCLEEITKGSAIAKDAKTGEKKKNAAPEKEGALEARQDKDGKKSWVVKNEKPKQEAKAKRMFRRKTI